MKRSNLIRGLVSIVVVSTASQAGAIVTDSGSNPALPSLLSLGGVGLLSNGCSSVLLAGGQYLLASAHCSAVVGGSVSFLGGAVTAGITSTVNAPGYDGLANDLSISRLDVPVTLVSGYAVSSSTALPMAVVLAGYGASGSGASGANGPSSTLRFGFNNYEILLADDPAATPPAIFSGTVAGFDFDDGSAASSHFGSLGQAGEAMVANGDSGGPSFAFIAGGWQIVGIHFSVEDGLGFGYGAIGYDVLVGHYAEWIDRVTAVPEPASGLLLAAGLLGLVGVARCRRR